MRESTGGGNKLPHFRRQQFIKPQESKQDSFKHIEQALSTADLREKYDWSDILQICQRGLDHRVIEQVLLKLLIQHYIEPVYITERQTSYCYKEAPDSTGIYIGTFSSTRNPIAMGRYPAIIIQRGDQEYQRLMMNDQTEYKYFTDQMTPEIELQFGHIHPQYLKAVRGAHVLLCVSQAAGEADALAVELADYLISITPIIIEKLPFIEFSLQKISAVAPLDPNGTLYSANLTCIYVYEHGWSIYYPSLSTPSMLIDSAHG